MYWERSTESNDEIVEKIMEESKKTERQIKIITTSIVCIIAFLVSLRWSGSVLASVIFAVLLGIESYLIFLFDDMNKPRLSFATFLSFSALALLLNLALTHNLTPEGILASIVLLAVGSVIWVVISRKC
ncbi:MAG: hypothetical protein DRN17_06220 [Thermoplasmata archaeon]|nr:MAG: hypothetical protein DRN17_06220 [Thermoplasmata archaeon]